MTLPTPYEFVAVTRFQQWATGTCKLSMSRVAAILALLIGGAALLGWQLGIPALYSITPNLPAMVPAAAGLTLLVGSGLLLTSVRPTPLRRGAALACALTVILVSAVLLLMPSGPASPSLATRLVLITLGIALLLLQSSQPPVLALGALSVFAVTLPLYRFSECLITFGHIHTEASRSPFSNMSLNTALALTLLAGPALFLHPRLPFGSGLFAAGALARLIRSILPWGTIMPVLLAIVIERTLTHRTEHFDFAVIVALGLLSAIATATLWKGYEKLRAATDVLKTSESLTRSIMDSLPHAIAVIDRSGTITAVNESWHRFAATNCADALTLTGTGLNYLDACRKAPDDHLAQQALAGIEDVLGGRQAAFFLEYPCHSPACQRWFVMRANPLRNAAEGLVISHIDITERKRAELEVQCDREQQTALRQILETLLRKGPLDETLGQCLDLLLAMPWLSVLPRGGIHLMAAVGDHLDLTVNRGLPPAVVAQCSHLPLNRCLCGRAAASRQIVFASRVDARHEVTYPDMADHGHFCVPLLGHGKDLIGVLVLYLQAGTPADPQREQFLATVAGMLASHVLRTRSELALQAAEAALRRQHQQLELKVRERTLELATGEARTRALLHSMADAVILIDSHGRILLVNDATTTLFGYEPEEIIGRNVRLLMPEPHRSRHDDYLENYRNTLERHILGRRIEVSGQHRDGHVFPLEVAVTALVDDLGTTFIGVLRDLTLQHAAQQALEQARREAERLARTKSEFLANMSHEIRTPLGAVIGLARIGMRENEGRRTQATCRRIFESGEYLLAVINDILDFSKIEAGKLIIDPQPFNLRALLDDTLALLAGRADEKGLALNRQLAASLPEWVHGDATRIRQILTNLLANAVKFTERGRIDLIVSREEAGKDDGDGLCFAVRDEGIGMTDAQLARLFTPFEQADSSTTRKYGGTGLGLAISKNLASLMGGDIRVRVNQAPRGCTFTVCLPLPATAAPPQSAAEKSAPAGRRLDGVRILAAEDVAINRLILADLLDSEGATHVFADNGIEAIDRVAATPGAFDAILMDVQMPELDGHAATRRILEIAPQLPVIGLTAHALAEERQRCLASGMVDHVTKPIDPDALVAAILRHVQPPETPAGAARPDPTATALATTGRCVAPAAEIDWPALQQRYRNKPGFIRKLLQTALESLAAAPGSLREVAQANDGPALAALAHRLKGIAGNLLAPGIQALADDSEVAARAAATAGFTQAERLADRVAGLIAEIEACLQRGEDT